MQNTITKRQIDELLEKSEIKVETVYSKVTVVSCKLPNGFVLTESSGAVDPANYDEKIGTEICMIYNSRNYIGLLNLLDKSINLEIYNSRNYIGLLNQQM